ncbi:hypothetical protein WOLCODRAFT_140903 [Wolfiporia cocos MD-104 SS10]|uniref:CRIB domain-containing protein n=1 Tax=Wolfiporia cocos (strain MD-104) TaxID=742152 RepID=A0A2H3J5J1_WOLCO|nr:hypothetical protein WOLCODRAFT_140903 [Wolfiporia cocos MD-104 SS10]
MTPGKGLIWTYEIPEDFRYRLDKPFFHVFPGKARMLGLRFDDDAEAGAFYKKITVQTRANVLPPRKITKSVSKPPPHQNASQLKLSTISAPAAGTFVHVSHVGFNNKGRLEASDNLSPTWKVMLEEIQGRGLTLDKLLRRRANDRAPPPKRDHVEGSVEITKPAKEPGEKKRRSPHRKPVALA